MKKNKNFTKLLEELNLSESPFQKSDEAFQQQYNSTLKNVQQRLKKNDEHRDNLSNVSTQKPNTEKKATVLDDDFSDTFTQKLYSKIEINTQKLYNKIQKITKNIEQEDIPVLQNREKSMDINQKNDHHQMPSQRLLQELKNLAVQLNSELKNQYKDNSVSDEWMLLNKLTSDIKKSWVTIVSTDQIQNKVPLLLKWEILLKDMESESSNWDHQKNIVWKDWISKNIYEIETLKSWVDAGSQNKNSDINQNTIEVPSLFKEKGIIPSPPPTVPQHLIEQLQSCADYWEYIQTKPQKFMWKNSPNHFLLNVFREKLKDWNPQNQQELDWKEKALERYIILDGRLTLKSVNTKPNLVETPKKILKKSI